MAYQIQLHRNSANRWYQLNPLLAEGEPGFETDTGKLKVGDGSTLWNDLPYFLPNDNINAPVTQADIDAHINSPLPHPVYDDGPDLTLIYENAKV
jgi:hypothetical protein